MADVLVGNVDPVCFFILMPPAGMRPKNRFLAWTIIILNRLVVAETTLQSASILRR